MKLLFLIFTPFNKINKLVFLVLNKLVLATSTWAFWWALRAEAQGWAGIVILLGRLYKSASPLSPPFGPHRRPVAPPVDSRPVSAPPLNPSQPPVHSPVPAARPPPRSPLRAHFSFSWCRSALLPQQPGAIQSGGGI